MKMPMADTPLSSLLDMALISGNQYLIFGVTDRFSKKYVS
jgi:hypothetical protein